MKPRVAVVVPTWNGGALAVESAGSVAKQTVQPHLFLVDNGSVDGSVEAIRARVERLTVIRNEQNLGYAAATNQGIRAAAGCDFVLLLNNDAVFPETSALEVPLRWFSEHPEAHGACGRYVYPDGRFQRFYNALPSALALAVYWGALRHVPGLLDSPAVRRYHCLDVDFSRYAALEQPSFTCVMLRRSSLETVGLLDEDFPIFFNDVDYCRRFADRGWHWDYLPDWTVVHHQSSTSSRFGRGLSAEMATSISRYATKHFSPAQALLVRLALLGEAAWRKLRHGDYPYPLGETWAGRGTFRINAD